MLIKTPIHTCEPQRPADASIGCWLTSYVSSPNLLCVMQRSGPIESHWGSATPSVPERFSSLGCEHLTTRSFFPAGGYPFKWTDPGHGVGA